MELMGAIAALEALTRPCSVELHSDSQYVVNAFNKHWVDGWQKSRLEDLAEAAGQERRPVERRLLAAMAPHDVSFVWVKGHAGHDLNERCDELATTAADDRASWAEDPGFAG
jgi:ribonuclease HI